MKTLIATLFFFCLLPVTSTTTNAYIQVPYNTTRKIEHIRKINVTQQLCVAKAVYFEARGEKDQGKYAVAHVVMNRAKLNKYNNDPCKVVHDSCQFSWKCDKKSDVPTDQEAWGDSILVAATVMMGYNRDNTAGATYFHSKKVRPSWRKEFVRTATIGKHVFYRIK